MKKTVKYIIEAVIIIAFLLVALYGISVIKPSVFGGEDYKDIEIAVEFLQVKKEFIDDIEIGDKMLENTQSTYFGEVIEVGEILPSIFTVSDYENGKYIETNSTEYVRRRVVLKNSARVFDNAIKIGEISVKVGGKYGLIFNGNFVDGTVMGLNVLE